MKDETIRPGDWVVVVKPLQCCGDCEAIGFIFKVAEIALATGECTACGDETPEITARAVVADPDSDGWSPSILKKIHPPALPETVDAAQEVEA